MYSTGHAGISVALYAPILFVLLISQLYGLAIIGGFVVLFLASIPDADMKFHQRSTILHKIPLFGSLIPTIKHRGISHTVWFMFLFGGFIAGLGYLIYGLFGMLFTVSRVEFSIFFFFFGSFGIFAHIMGDYITPTGINILYPSGQRRVFTVHSSNMFLVSFRPASEVRGTIRNDGVLTRADNKIANKIANMIGIMCIFWALIASIVYLINLYDQIIILGAFIAGYFILIGFPIVISQWKEIIKYISPF